MNSCFLLTYSLVVAKRLLLSADQKHLYISLYNSNSICWFTLAPDATLINPQFLTHNATTGPWLLGGNFFMIEMPCALVFLSNSSILFWMPLRLVQSIALSASDLSFYA